MSNKIISVIRLLRVRQWYKNVLMFFGIFFGGQLFNFEIYPRLIIGFILVCLVSSLNYIHNDIRDIEKDKLHEEKCKTRPLANGDLTKNQAWAIYFTILIFEIVVIRFYLYEEFPLFCLLIIAIYLNGLLYNLYFKKVAFADIIALSMIYVWRTLAGCILASIMISPWLFVLVFLLAIFLATAKRIADFEYLGDKNAIKHKEIYDTYSQKLLDYILMIVSTSLFMTYIMYCVFGPKEPDTSIISEENSSLLLYTMPVVLYIIIRFLYLIHAKPEIARDVGKMVKDRGLIYAGVLVGLILLITFYYLPEVFQDIISRIF